MQRCSFAFSIGPTQTADRVQDHPASGTFVAKEACSDLRREGRRNGTTRSARRSLSVLGPPAALPPRLTNGEDAVWQEYVRGVLQLVCRPAFAAVRLATRDAPLERALE